MKRRPVLAVIFLGLALFAGAGFALVTRSARLAGATNAPTATQVVSQAVARSGSLTVTISGAGQIVAAAETALGFGQSGVIVALNVIAGDQVPAGALLARLQVDQTAAELSAAVAAAQLAVVQAQATLTQLSDNAALASAQALTALEAARQAVTDLENQRRTQAGARQALAEAGGAVADAELQLALLKAVPSQEDLDILHADLLFKEKAIRTTQDQIARLDYQVRSAPNSQLRDPLKNQLADVKLKLLYQQIEYEKKRYRYLHLADPPDPFDLTLAQTTLAADQARLARTQADLEQALAGPAGADLALATAELARAQDRWELLQARPDPVEVALAQAQLAAAQAQLALAKGARPLVDLVAPINGTVLSVSAAEGDRIHPGTILQLADLTQPWLEVSVDETDLNQVKVGSRAEIIFNAYPDSQFTGTILAIDPSLADARGASVGRVLIGLDSLPAGSLRILPVGLNASVDILAGQVDNAVLVPVEALHAAPSGGASGRAELFVYVVNSSGLEIRRVRVGLSDYTTAAILEGLAAGEVVALGDSPNLEGGP